MNGNDVGMREPPQHLGLCRALLGHLESHQAIAEVGLPGKINPSKRAPAQTFQQVEGEELIARLGPIASVALLAGEVCRLAYVVTRFEPQMGAEQPPQRTAI